VQLPSTQTRTPTETTLLRSRPVIRQTKALSRNLNRLMKSLWPLKPPTRSNKLPQTNVWCPNSKLRPQKPLEWTTSITFMRLLQATDPPGKQNYLPCHQATASVTTSMQLQWTVHLRNKCHKLNSRREATKGHQRVWNCKATLLSRRQLCFKRLPNLVVPQTQWTLKWVWGEFWMTTLTTLSSKSSRFPSVLKFWGS